jgi:hypothetical protein
MNNLLNGKNFLINKGIKILKKTQVHNSFILIFHKLF